MSWATPLARPLTVSGQVDLLRTVRDAVALLDGKYNSNRNMGALNGVLMALALAVSDGRAEEIASATDQLETFLEDQRREEAA